MLVWYLEPKHKALGMKLPAPHPAHGGLANVSCTDGVGPRCCHPRDVVKEDLSAWYLWDSTCSGYKVIRSVALSEWA